MNNSKCFLIENIKSTSAINEIPIFTLSNLANGKEKGIFSLPTVQRDFVWKVNQIENLWDSILRGYPIGAIVLAPVKHEPNEVPDAKYELLDGQQRVTAIAIGFGKKTFRIETADRFKLFIDLLKPDSEDLREYVFRVITRSHPWGYSYTDNTRTLNTEDRNKAMRLYGKDEFINEPLIDFFPYDSHLPLPYEYFLEAAEKSMDCNELIQHIKVNWLNSKNESMWDIVNKVWSDWLRDNVNEENRKQKEYNNYFEIENETQIENRICQIFEKTKQILALQKIPALYLDFESLKKQMFSEENSDQKFVSKTKLEINAHNSGKDEDEIDEQENDDESYEDKKVDPIENLFIRLNTGGTILRGEDLNYSILKSHLKDKKLIRELEEACSYFIQPARFITIAFKIFQCLSKQKDRDVLSMKIKPRQFQKELETKDLLNKKNSNNPDNIKSFENFLKELISDRETQPNNKTLIEHTLDLIAYDKENKKYGLPPLLTSNLAHEAPEVLFILMYRLYFLDFKEVITENLNKKIIGTLTLLNWFGKGKNQRDHQKILVNVWPAVQTLPCNEFWSSSIYQRAQLGELFTIIPSYKARIHKGANALNKTMLSIQKSTSIYDKLKKESPQFASFVKILFKQKGFVIYAQREFLVNFFTEDEIELEDTNMPFDWDHIFAEKYAKSGIAKPLKDIYSSIGNYRAWPYSMNRSDQADSPAKKFDPINENCWEGDSQKYLQSKEAWETFIKKKRLPINNTSELSKYIIVGSECYKILGFKNINLKKDWKGVYEYIINRSFNLFKKWYDELLIEELISYNEANLNEALKSNWSPLSKINKSTKLFKSLYVEGYEIFILKLNISTFSPKSYFFIQYQKDPRKVLYDYNVLFGIITESDSNKIASLNIPIKMKDRIEQLDDTLFGSFTLLSFSDYSLSRLVNEMEFWLIDLKKELKIKEDIVSQFKYSIKVKYLKK